MSSFVSGTSGSGNIVMSPIEGSFFSVSVTVLPSSLGGCGTGVGAGVTGSVGSGSGVTSVSLPSVVGGVSTCILHTWLASTIVPSSLYSTLPM